MSPSSQRKEFRFPVWSRDTSDFQIELWVAPYPGPGRPTQVSTTGGGVSIWSPSGEEILYRGSGVTNQQIFATTIGDDAGFSRSQPQMLFEFGTPFSIFDVHPDGERFLFGLTGDPEQRRPEIVFVQNWFEELKERVPVD